MCSKFRSYIVFASSSKAHRCGLHREEHHFAQARYQTLQKELLQGNELRENYRKLTRAFSNEVFDQPAGS